MITKEDLNNYMHLKNEIAYLEKKIENYKPAEIVVDSVRGSSPVFPYVEHTIKIEGLEIKKDKLSDYYVKLLEYNNKLKKEEAKIELEIEKIASNEIKQIIRYKYIERLNYVQIMNKMGYNTPETPRIKLRRFLGGKNE